VEFPSRNKECKESEELLLELTYSRPLETASLLNYFSPWFSHPLELTSEFILLKALLVSLLVPSSRTISTLGHQSGIVPPEFAQALDEEK
jgi:hypothetical protein